MMKMKDTIIVILTALLLSACAGGDHSSTPASNEPVYQTEENSKASLPDTAADVGFKVRITGYAGGVLTYITDTEHKAAVDPHCFENDSDGRLSGLIIAKHTEEEIYGIIKLDRNGDRIISCDVITPNGDYFNNTMLKKGYKDTSIEDDEVSLRRTGGSLCELYNGYETVTADLNDLESCYKADLPEQLDRVIFEGYRLTGGSFILQSLSVFSGIDEMGSYIYEPLTVRDKYSFFGTVQSLAEGRARVLLTDGRTLCDVPVCLNDGELKEGMQVMITLNAAPSLFDSGKEYKDEFAVFHTDPAEYNYSGFEFTKLAYAQYNETYVAKYDYTFKGETDLCQT